MIRKLPRITSDCLPVEPFDRVRFYQGQILTTADLQDEQNYQDGKRQLLNRCLHGSGIVCGFEITLSERSLVVAPGLALDCLGREIMISEPLTIDVSHAELPVFLNIEYTEVPVKPVPSQDTTGNPVFTRMRESAMLLLSDKSPMSGHHHGRNGRWSSCGSAHPVLLARVSVARGQVTIRAR